MAAPPAKKQSRGGYKQINKALNICAFEDYLEAQQSSLPEIADVEQISPRVLRVLGQNAGKVSRFLSLLVTHYYDGQVTDMITLVHSPRHKHLHRRQGPPTPHNRHGPGSSRVGNPHRVHPLRRQYLPLPRPPHPLARRPHGRRARPAPPLPGPRLLHLQAHPLPHTTTHGRRPDLQGRR